jgi:hypothetical protein
LIKDTTELQISSVVNFALALGANFTENYFILQGHKVTFNRMKDWHNGSFGRWGFSADSYYRTALNTVKHYTHGGLIRRAELARAFDSRQVETCYVRWSKKRSQYVTDKHQVKMVNGASIS